MSVFRQVIETNVPALFSVVTDSWNTLGMVLELGPQDLSSLS